MVEDLDIEPEPGPGRRWFLSWFGVGLALGALLTAAAWWIVRPAHAPAAPSTATSTVDCAWHPPATPDPQLREVGTPPVTGNPRGGTATLRLETNLGTITIAMDRQNAPCTVASFRYLASRHFFDGTRCHRLTTKGIFVLQCGDPTGTGQGGPSYEYDDENLPRPDPGGTGTAIYSRGTVAMANAGPGTNGSQFFITYRDTTLHPNYAVLGTVTSGLDVVDRVAAGGNEPYVGSEDDGTPKLGPTLNSVTVSP